MSSFKYSPAVTCLDCLHQGKVRDTFIIPNYHNLLLQVATNRVSTHDTVHLSEIPGKGRILTALTRFWMEKVLTGYKTHLVASGRGIYDYLPAGDYPKDLHERALVVKKLHMVPVEFIFRSRMAGRLWKSYRVGKDNSYGIELPPELDLMSKFDVPIFTPTEKSDVDDPINSERIKILYGDAYELALEVYKTGSEYAKERGIEIIDGKFEVGIDDEGLPVLADECLTPDSCRFVKAGEIVEGKEPAWLDKQFLRAEAEKIWGGGKKEPLYFSRQVVEDTIKRYEEILLRLTKDKD